MSKYFGEDALTELWQSVIGETVKAARVAVGSYVGNETYGKDNPNKLVFDFEPKFVLVVMDEGMLSNEYNTSVVLFRPCTRARTGSGTNDYISVTWGENSVSWYSDVYTSQLNSRFKYNYIAIG